MLILKYFTTQNFRRKPPYLHAVYIMADDTREPPSTSASLPSDQSPTDDPRARRPKPKHDFPKSQAGKLWDAFGNPDEPVNTLPGGTYNSAGGKPAQVSWKDAFSFSYNSKGPSWYQTPCARDSLLVGIGSGGAIGGISFILKGTERSLVVISAYASSTFSARHAMS